MYSRPYEQLYEIVDRTDGNREWLPRKRTLLARVGALDGGAARHVQNDTTGLGIHLGGRMKTQQENTGLELRVYSTLEAARDIWLAFEKTALGFAYQQFVWAKHWHEVVGKPEGYKLHIVEVVNSAGDTLMLVPLCFHKSRFNMGLYFIGEGMSDYLSPLIHENFAENLNGNSFESLWQEILATLSTKIDFVWLDRLPVKIISQDNPFASLQGFEFDSQCHALNYPEAENWAKSARLVRSNKTAKKIERRIRQLAKVGELELIEITKTKDRVRHMKELIALKVDNLNAANLLHRFDKSGIEKFYTGLVADESAQENLCQFELRCDGKLVASVFGLAHHQTFYYQICAYNREDFGQYSPGLLLMYQLFDWSFERGFKRFDMTIGDEAYKQDWTNQSLSLKTVAYGLTTAGNIELAKGQFMRWLKNKIKQSPALRKVTMKILNR